jgi:hypothetical protein
MKVLLIFSLIISTKLFASKEVGNGGDAVVCRNNQGDITSVELLDYYEARVMRGIEVNLGDESLTVEEKVELVLKRLEKRAPIRFKTYKNLLDQFYKESKFISGVHLVDIPDSENVILGKGCVVEQLAIQQQPIFDEDPRYLINKDLWDLMSSDHQAGLILHEVIYYEAIHQENDPHHNSKLIRYYNSFISSELVSKSTNKVFYENLQKSKLFAIETIQSLPVNLFQQNLVFNKNDIIPMLESTLGRAHYVQGRSVLSSSASYHQNGKVKSIALKQTERLNSKKYVLNCSAKSIVYFDEDELLIEGRINPGQTIKDQNYDIKFNDIYNITFYETTGNLKTIQKQVWDYSDWEGDKFEGKVIFQGKWVTLGVGIPIKSKEQYVEFNEQGIFIYGYLADVYFNYLDQTIFFSTLHVYKNSYEGLFETSQNIKHFEHLLKTSPSSSIDFDQQSLLNVEIENEIRFQDIWLTGKITYFPLGIGDRPVVFSGTLASDQSTFVKGQNLILKKDALIYFHINGGIDLTYVNKNTFILHGLEFSFEGAVRFDKNGMLSRAQLSENAELKCANGKIAKFNGKDSVNFDQNGFVLNEMAACKLF